MLFMRSKTPFLAMVSLVACSDITDSTNNAIEGTCEEWTVEPETAIWPPDHEMHQFTLDDCVIVTQVECPLPDEPVCGNGVVEGTEECDDGNTNPFDGCDECILVDINPGKRTPTVGAALAPATAVALRVTSISSSESDNALGDGTTSNDYRIIDAVTFELRAERGGGRDGRVYRVNFVDQDGETGTCRFSVPESFSK
jgi:cysteine-rich repeat protein